MGIFGQQGEREDKGDTDLKKKKGSSARPPREGIEVDDALKDFKKGWKRRPWQGRNNAASLERKVRDTSDEIDEIRERGQVRKREKGSLS